MINRCPLFCFWVNQFLIYVPCGFVEFNLRSFSVGDRYLLLVNHYSMHAAIQKANHYPCRCLKRGFFLLMTYNLPFLRTILHSGLLFLMDARTRISLIVCVLICLISYVLNLRSEWNRYLYRYVILPLV